MAMKCFIIMRDRLTWARNLARQCAERGLDVILVDNDSTYPPLLEWYKEQEYQIVYTQRNRDTWVEWYNILLHNVPDRYFIITDPDLDISGVPDDFLEVMQKGLAENDVLKCGLSLDISDLPESEYTKKVIEHEAGFWKKKNGVYYIADVSTTFALYDRTGNPEFLSAVRCPYPYTARHLSWYLTELNEEEEYYQQHTLHKGWKP